MKNSFFRLFVVIFFCFIPFLKTGAVDVPTDAHDIHLVIETSRTYMDHTIKYTDEYWLADDKIYQKRNHRIFITRDDLELIWSIDVEEKTYSERKMESQSGIDKEPQDKSDQREVQEEDIHNLGFHYESDYDWEIKETDEVKEINGFPCRLFLAEGDADFSEINLKFWISTDSQFPGAAELHEFMLEQLERDKERKPILDTLKKYRNAVPVRWEQIIENPISSTMHYETRLITLEMAKAPLGIYDLPPDLKNRAK